MVIAAALERWAATRPDAVAVEHGGRRWPATDLHRRAGEAAGALAASGIRPGAIVALMLSDPVDLLVGLAATDRLAATGVVVDAYAPQAVRGALLATVRPALVVDSLPGGGGVPPRIAGDGGTPFLGTCTSGSTGMPRVVLRSRRSWAASFAPFSVLAGVESGDRVLVPGPLAASLSLYAAAHALAVGARVVLDRPGTARPWSHVHTVPAVLADVLAANLAGERDLAGRTAVVGGAALPAELAAQVRQRGMTLLCYYGSSELSFVAAGPDPGSMPPFPWAEVAVREGVAWARSPYLADGYLGAGGPYRRDADGWATVGDLAETDGDGRLRVRGRGGSAVLSGATVVVPEEVEAVLREVRGVADVVVVGVPHGRLGALVAAVVEPEPGGAGTRGADLRAAARERLAPAWRPRSWWQVERLPRTPGGKPDRAAVAAGLAGGAEGGDRLGARPLR